MFAVLCWTGHWALAQDNWEVATHRDGVLIETREVPDSAFRAFRAHTRIGAPVESILALLDDAPAFPAWIAGCSEGRLLGQGDFFHRLTYQVNDMPLWVTDRDLVMEVLVEPLADGTFRLNLSNRPDALPDQGRVRVTQASGHYLLRPLGRTQTELRWEQHTEPGGDLPAWLVNELLVDIPLNTLLQMKVLLENPLSPYRSARLQRDAEGRIVGWADALGELPLVGAMDNPRN
jgi:hypothetical protein